MSAICADAGKANPPINGNSKYGQWEAINEDIPAFLKCIEEHGNSDLPLHGIGHSWGGVLLLAYHAKFNDQKPFDSFIFYGSKRRITVNNLKKIWNINFMWNGLGAMLINFYGYLPARQWKFGGDNEPKAHFRQLNAWIPPESKWIDSVDGFNYGEKLKDMSVPPTLYLAGSNDHYLGNPVDVKILMDEADNEADEFRLLSKANGYSLDYGHIDMLTAPSAVDEQYRETLEWMQKHDKKSAIVQEKNSDQLTT